MTAKRQTGLILLAGAMFAAGCASVREAREAQRGDRRAPGERPVSAQEIGLNLQDPLTMEEAVRVALYCHPAMVQASQAVVAELNLTPFIGPV